MGDVDYQAVKKQVLVAIDAMRASIEAEEIQVLSVDIFSECREASTAGDEYTIRKPTGRKTITFETFRKPRE